MLHFLVSPELMFPSHEFYLPMGGFLNCLVVPSVTSFFAFSQAVNIYTIVRSTENTPLESYL